MKNDSLRLHDRDLPEVVRNALACRNEHYRAVESASESTQVTSFRYVTPTGEAILAQFGGPLPVPPVGEEVHLYNMSEGFQVSRTKSWYGFSDSGDRQIVRVWVYVEPLKP